MIARLIEFSLRNRFLVLCALLLLVAWGGKAVFSTPVDAIPDLSENQVKDRPPDNFRHPHIG